MPLRVLPALLLLAACAGPDPGAGPGTASLAAEPEPAFVARGARSGLPQQVAFYASLNPDCSSLPLNPPDVIRPPASGRVAFESRNDFAFYRPDNPRAVCNNRRVPGLAVIYTSNPGFRGTDAFVFRSLSALGTRTTYAYRVTVE